MASLRAQPDFVRRSRRLQRREPQFGLLTSTKHESGNRSARKPPTLKESSRKRRRLYNNRSYKVLVECEDGQSNDEELYQTIPVAKKPHQYVSLNRENVDSITEIDVSAFYDLEEDANKLVPEVEIEEDLSTSVQGIQKASCDINENLRKSPASTELSNKNEFTEGNDKDTGPKSIKGEDIDSSEMNIMDESNNNQEVPMDSCAGLNQENLLVQSKEVTEEAELAENYLSPILEQDVTEEAEEQIKIKNDNQLKENNRVNQVDGGEMEMKEREKESTTGNSDLNLDDHTTLNESNENEIDKICIIEKYEGKSGATFNKKGTTKKDIGDY